MRWPWIAVNVAFYTTIPALVVERAYCGDAGSTALWAFILGWFLRGDVARLVRRRRAAA